MKKILTLIILISLFASVLPVGAVNTENFYFEDFTGDYYLTKDAEGVSHLRVVENVTTVFPDYEQNKGICRQVPLTNNGGKNVTLPDLNRSNMKLLRNGKQEPIYSINKYDDYYSVCTGTEEYVLGKQVYTFEYEFEKVVTEYDDYQELYWDTNGNGSKQKFDKVTARVHFGDGVEELATGRNWCYVGKYGQKGQERCVITELEDGVQFATTNLDSYENMTFDVELKPGGFVVPPPEVNYILVWWLCGLIGVCALVLVLVPGRKWWKIRPLKKYYKGLFVTPQYQPDGDYSIAEMGEVYLGKKKDIKVAMLLDLIVKKKVSIMRGEGKEWSLRVNSLDGVRSEGRDLLKLLKGEDSMDVGDVIKVEEHRTNSVLRELDKRIDYEIGSSLKNDALVEKRYPYKGTGARRGTLTAGVVNLIVYGMFLLYPAMFLVAIVSDITDEFHGVVLLENEFMMLVVIVLTLTGIVWWWLNKDRKKYEFMTEKGLTVASYMDGLKMYISMAEADRLQFLQSVDGADTTSAGIVNLYEKLLPYAAVFGLEKSWMNELEKYCKLQEIETPDFLGDGINANELSRMTRNAASYASYPEISSSSGGGGIGGGGGWSSSGSGGGGGGFSGGGGGGGGFSGR